MRACGSRWLVLALALALCAQPTGVWATPALRLMAGLGETRAARPLETLSLFGAGEGAIVVVTDGDGREYLRARALEGLDFQVGGSLGTHHVRVIDALGTTRARLAFEVDVQTRLEEDSGRFEELFEMARDTLTVRDPSGDNGGASPGGHNPRSWRGRSYQLYVGWLLDHAEVSKGMAFFSPHIRDGVELVRESQQPDGKVWSFVELDRGRDGYWDSAYGHLGCVWHDGGAMFVRQPVENHGEYQYVQMLHRAWQASGDDALMRGSLDSAARALEYGFRSPVRFSQRFGLLKRPYTIDSWDFQVDDAYLVRDTLTPTMTYHPEQTKFGVFFGDNTGYAHACELLAQMLEHAGRGAEAAHFRERAGAVRKRLTELAWNGRFFRHFTEEDASVQRQLGVDEASQLAQANAYSLNRGLAQPQAAAILQTYMALSSALPPGSPGEWYAIYPPFGRGFGDPETRWQYMNGGVAGHAAGELARGAFEHGFEAYGVSVLERSAALAKRTDRKIHFAYTGAFLPPAQPQTFSPVDLSKQANMDKAAPSRGKPFMDGEPGNDLAQLPVGTLQVGEVPFRLLDPARNRQRALVAVAARRGFARTVEIPFARQRAGALYLLHTLHRGRRLGGGPGFAGEVAAGLSFRYLDGSERSVYLRRGTHVAGWWYPELRGPFAGVGYRGANKKTGDVGLTWSAVPNPEPDKALKGLRLSASLEGGVYALAALTLASRMPQVQPDVISYGGPDTWAGSTMMLALIEGIAGVRDLSRAYEQVQVAPRWAAADVAHAEVVARYAASRGYVAYRFEHARERGRLSLTWTGSSTSFLVRILLPAGASLRSAQLDGKDVSARSEQVESSRYVSLPVPAGVHRLSVRYAPEQ